MFSMSYEGYSEHISDKISKDIYICVYIFNLQADMTVNAQAPVFKIMFSLFFYYLCTLLNFSVFKN